MILPLVLMLSAPGASPPLTVRGALPADEMRVHFADYARCVVRWNRARASRAILANLDINALEHQYGDIFLTTPVTYVSGCRELRIPADTAVTFSGEALRSSLAEALVKAEFGESGPACMTDRAALTQAVPQPQAAFEAELASAPPARRPALQHHHDEMAAKAWLDAFAECVARRDAPNARGWIFSVPASAEEAAAVKALSPSLGECLPQGRQLNFRKDILRGAIAVNYYRLAKAPVAATTGVVH